MGLQVPRFTGLQVYRFTGLQVYRFTGFAHRFTGSQVHRFSTVRTIELWNRKTTFKLHLSVFGVNQGK